MSVLAFSIGSFGDIITIIQLASAIRDALSETAGAPKQIRELVADIDSFTRALEDINAAIKSMPTPMPDGLCRRMAHALEICSGVLKKAKARLDKYQRGISKVALWRKVFTASAWEMLGGKREIAEMKSRLLEQIEVIQMLLAVSNAQRFDQFAAESGKQKEDVVDTMRKLQARVTFLPTMTSPFVFMDQSGAQSLPLATIPFQRFLDLTGLSRGFVDLKQIVMENRYVTVTCEYPASAGISSFVTMPRSEHVLGEYTSIPWADGSIFHGAFGCFIYWPDPDVAEPLVYISNVFHEKQLRTRGNGELHEMQRTWVVHPRMSSHIAGLLRSTDTLTGGIINMAPNALANMWKKGFGITSHPMSRLIWGLSDRVVFVSSCLTYFMYL